MSLALRHGIVRTFDAMRATSWKRGRGAVLACALLAACGDDSSTEAVPFDSIPKEKKLTELAPGEKQGVCQWAQGVAAQKLAPGGTPVTCNGNPLNFNSCSTPSATQVNCTGTVGQWEACLPNFLDRIAHDPCVIFSLAFSQTELETFVNETPGCAGLGPCAYTIQG